MARSASAIPSPLLPIFSNTKQGFFYNEVLLKNILSLTLTLGCKNKKRPSGPIELDLEAGNLVWCSKHFNEKKTTQKENMFLLFSRNVHGVCFVTKSSEKSACNKQCLLLILFCLQGKN